MYVCANCIADWDLQDRLSPFCCCSGADCEICLRLKEVRLSSPSLRFVPHLPRFASREELLRCLKAGKRHHVL
jgi:hypothetical protein